MREKQQEIKTKNELAERKLDKQKEKWVLLSKQCRHQPSFTVVESNLRK